MIQQRAPSFHQKLSDQNWQKTGTSLKERNNTNAKKSTQEKFNWVVEANRDYSKCRQNFVWDLWGEKWQINGKRVNFENKIDVSKTQIKPNQRFYSRKATVANYWKFFSQKKTGSSLFSRNGPKRSSQFSSKSKLIKCGWKLGQVKMENVTKVKRSTRERLNWVFEAKTKVFWGVDKSLLRICG